MERAGLAARVDRVDVDVPAIAGLVGDVLVADPALGVEAVDVEREAVLVEGDVVGDVVTRRHEPRLEQRARLAFGHRRDATAVCGLHTREAC